MATTTTTMSESFMDDTMHRVDWEMCTIGDPLLDLGWMLATWYLPGTEPVALQAGPLRVGLSICYDLRFPELYRALMRPPCDLLCVPSAFTVPTGRAHWELLLRARAVENQCYVIAAAQGGLHPNGRRTWGHSLVIDPWGEVLAELPEGEGVVLADLDPARLADVRGRLPALAHRRTPLD